MSEATKTLQDATYKTFRSAERGTTLLDETLDVDRRWNTGELNTWVRIIQNSEKENVQILDHLSIHEAVSVCHAFATSIDKEPREFFKQMFLEIVETLPKMKEWNALVRTPDDGIKKRIDFIIERCQKALEPRISTPHGLSGFDINATFANFMTYPIGKFLKDSFNTSVWTRKEMLPWSHIIRNSHDQKVLILDHLMLGDAIKLYHRFASSDSVKAKKFARSYYNLLHMALEYDPKWSRMFLQYRGGQTRAMRLMLVEIESRLEVANKPLTQKELIDRLVDQYMDLRNDRMSLAVRKKPETPEEPGYTENDPSESAFDPSDTTVVELLRNNVPRIDDSSQASLSTNDTQEEGPRPIENGPQPVVILPAKVRQDQMNQEIVDARTNMLKLWSLEKMVKQITPDPHDLKLLSRYSPDQVVDLYELFLDSVDTETKRFIEPYITYLHDHIHESNIYTRWATLMVGSPIYKNTHEKLQRLANRVYQNKKQRLSMQLLGLRMGLLRT